MHPTLLLRGAAIAGTGALLAAGSASAATLALDHGCYINPGGSSAQQPIVAAATGLTPGADYNVGFSAKGSSETGYAYGTADAAGNLSLTINSWYGGSTFDIKTYDATVVLRDSSTNAVLATSDTKTTTIGVDVTGSGAKRTWKVTGLAAYTGGTTYYAHYFSGTKYRGRLKVGKPSGPCGYFKGKRPLTPFHKIGRYDVKVTTTKKWHAGDPFIPGRIVVTKHYL